MPTVIDLDGLLDVLGYTDAELVQLGSRPPGGTFNATVVGRHHLPDPDPQADNWFGVNPVRWDNTTDKGRPGATHVTRLAAVWADLDVKRGGCADYSVARDIIDDLSGLLGVTPVAITSSGNGLQPYWAVEHQPIADETPADSAEYPITAATARAVLRRWGRLVANAAERRGAKVDTVFDLPRILRRPASSNHKNPADPKPVVTVATGGAPVDIDRLLEVLTENGIAEQDDDHADPGATLSPPDEWTWAAHTCTYARRAIDGWSADTPDARHPWLTGQAVRIAAMHRNGCLTETGRADAIEQLTGRFRALLQTGQVRAENPGEIHDALTWGIQRAAALTPGALAGELGSHAHLDNIVVDMAPPPRGRHLTAVPTPDVDGTAALADPEATPGRLTSQSDHGNATLMVDRYGGALRYIPERGKWLSWEGTRWKWCVDDGEPVQAAVETISALTGDLVAKHRTRSLSRRGLEACVGVAAMDARVRESVNRIDADPWALTTPAGIVDLRTGTRRATTPDDLVVRSVGVDYDDSAAAPSWQQFLLRTFDGDTELIDYLQRLAGYTATGRVTHHVLPFLHGGGHNGKTVFLHVVLKVLGDYASPGPLNMLLQGGKQDEPAIARLAGLRMVVASEVNQRDRFDEAKIKSLTGGDAITSRFLFKDYFTFEPSHTIWLMGNHQPRVEAGGEGFWRRLRLIPFNVTIPAEERELGLKERLVAEEGPGILNWIIAGATAEHADGIKEPATVLAATNRYANEEDAFARFVEDCCHIGGGHLVKVNTAAVWSAYESWCRDEGDQPVSRQVFGRELRSRWGIESIRSNGQRFYTGMALIERDRSLDDEDPRATHWSDR